jgi:hypothetical protein
MNTAPVGTMYKAPGTHTKKMRDFLFRFNYEYLNLKPSAAKYERTTAGYLEDLNQAKLNLLNARRNEARIYKENYESLKAGLDKKKEQILFPNSNSWNEQAKQTALMQRQLAISRLSSGSIDKEAFAKEIEDNFKNGNIDYNGEAYNYLLNDKRLPLETSLHLIDKLKQGFNARGLQELKDLKEDLADSEQAYLEIKKTFQL